MIGTRNSLVVFDGFTILRLLAILLDECNGFRDGGRKRLDRSMLVSCKTFQSAQ